MKINDPVYITANFYHPQSGYSINADVTPAWTVYESGAQIILQGSMISRGTGSYWANFMATAANGFNTGLFYDVEVSGAVGGVTVFASVKSFVLGEILDANVVQVSGEDVTYSSSIVNANVVQLSGVPVSPQEAVDANVISISGVPVSLSSFQTDISGLDQDIYFAQIKWVSDLTNNRDEFAVQWYKNDQPVGSGALTNPRISAYNTATGTALFAGQSMAYASPLLGVVRYNHTSMVFASGEPYLVETSGTIDSVMRTWKNIVGIDLL